MQTLTKKSKLIQKVSHAQQQPQIYGILEHSYCINMKLILKAMQHEFHSTYYHHAFTKAQQKVPTDLNNAKNMIIDAIRNY